MANEPLLKLQWNEQRSKKGIIANEDYVASAHFQQDCIRARKSNSAQFQQKEANFTLI